MFHKVLLFLAISALVVSAAFITDFGMIRGEVHDPRHRPILSASVTIKSATSDWTQTMQSDQARRRQTRTANSHLIDNEEVCSATS